MAKVMISFPEEPLAKIDARAREHGSTRSATLRELAEDGLRERAERLSAAMVAIQHGAGAHGGRSAEQVKAGRLM